MCSMKFVTVWFDGAACGSVFLGMWCTCVHVLLKEVWFQTAHWQGH